MSSETKEREVLDLIENTPAPAPPISRELLDLIVKKVFERGGQTKLSRETGIPVPTISRVMNGYYLNKSQRVRDVIEALGIKDVD